MVPIYLDTKEFDSIAVFPVGLSIKVIRYITQ